VNRPETKRGGAVALLAPATKKRVSVPGVRKGGLTVTMKKETQERGQQGREVKIESSRVWKGGETHAQG